MLAGQKHADKYKYVLAKVHRAWALNDKIAQRHNRIDQIRARFFARRSKTPSDQQAANVTKSHE